MTTLDLDAVRAFVLIADLQSFTRAAAALDTSQSAVSLKLKRLEQRIGRRLLERTPRRVRLSGEGVAFLPAARDLVSAHERALGRLTGEQRRITVGISDHVAGASLPAILARMNASDPALVLHVRIASSHDVFRAFERGKLDAAVVRQEADQRGGEVLFNDPLGWFASADFQHQRGKPLPVATLAPPCGIRAIAVKALESARLSWTEAFVGGGVAAVAAAVSAGLGIAALARRVAPPDAVEVSGPLELPRLPSSKVMLHSSVSDPGARRALRTLASAFAQPLRSYR